MEANRLRLDAVVPANPISGTTRIEKGGLPKDEPRLERCGVGVRDGAKLYPGAKPWEVADELSAFEAKLRATVARLDAKYWDDDSLDDDRMSAVIDLAA